MTIQTDLAELGITEDDLAERQTYVSALLTAEADGGESRKLNAAKPRATRSDAGTTRGPKSGIWADIPGARLDLTTGLGRDVVARLCAGEYQGHITAIIEQLVREIEKLKGK